MNLRPRPLLVRTILAICCALLVGAQIGSFTHALTHFGQAASTVADSGQGKSASPNREAGSCDLCLSFGGLAHFLQPAPLALAAPISFDYFAAAAVALAALAVLPLYRSRAPPALLR